MSHASEAALSVARPAIQLLTVVNALYALVLALLLTYSFFIPDWPRNRSITLQIWPSPRCRWAT